MKEGECDGERYKNMNWENCTPNSYVYGFLRWGLCKISGSGGWGPHHGVSALTRRDRD